MAHSATTLTDDIDSEFELDLRVIEDSLPLAKMRCNTDDNCGQTCSGSACNSLTGTPF